MLWKAKVDRIYLDTTYCAPEYDLPSQSDVIARAVDLVREFVLMRPSTVVLCGAYSVGKERIFKSIAVELDCKLWTSAARVKVWHCLQDRDILDRMVRDRSQARVQVVDMRVVGWGGLSQELDKVGAQYNHILGIKPTGWTHSRGEGQEVSLADVRIVTKGQLSIAGPWSISTRNTPFILQAWLL